MAYVPSQFGKQAFGRGKFSQGYEAPSITGVQTLPGISQAALIRHYHFMSAAQTLPALAQRAEFRTIFWRDAPPPPSSCGDWTEGPALPPCDSWALELRGGANWDEGPTPPPGGAWTLVPRKDEEWIG